MKKLMKKSLLMLLTALLLFGSVATVATLTTASEVQAASKIGLNKTKLTLVVGKTYTLKTKGTSKKATWTTSKKSVAAISAKKKASVKITAKKVGKSTITAKIGKKTYKCVVTVVNPKISKSKLSLTVGNTSTLKVTGGTGTIKWASADKSIATVSNKGKVTTKKAGTVKITATQNGKKLTCTVTVNPIPKPTKKPTPTPTKKPVPTATPKPTATPIPKPTATPTGGISLTKTNYGIRKYIKNEITGVFTPCAEVTYYNTKEDMPYEFNTTGVYTGSCSKYSMRRWVVAGANVVRSKTVDDKAHAEWECTCGKGWGLGFITADVDAFDTHSAECGWNWRVLSVKDEIHEEITKGGYWEYYNPPTNSWY